MKFDEVTTQFVLTRHVIGYDVLSIRSKIWDALKPEQQAKFQADADKAIDENTERIQQAGRRNDRVSSRRKARRSTSRIRMPSAPSRRSATSRSTARTGRRARSSVSTRSSKTLFLRFCVNECWSVRWIKPTYLADCGRPERSVIPNHLSAARWLRRRAENVSVALLLRHVCDLHRADFRSLRAQQSDRLDGRGDHHDVALDGVVGRGLHSAVSRKKSVSTSSIQAVSERTAPHLYGASPGLLWLCCTVCRCQPPTIRQLHEGRTVGVPARADQLAVLRLSHLQRCLHLSLLLAGLARPARKKVTRNRSGKAGD